jgi:hypothetical protein
VRVSPPSISKALQTGDTSAMVLIEYTGNNAGTFRMKGKGTGNAYRFGASAEYRQRYVLKDDVAGLLALAGFVRVDAPLTDAALSESQLLTRDRHAN